MDWISVKDALPAFGKRVFVVLRFQINIFCIDEEPKYHYWISIGKYCCIDGWKLELINPSSDQVFFWSEIDFSEKDLGL